MNQVATIRVLYHHDSAKLPRSQRTGATPTTVTVTAGEANDVLRELAQKIQALLGEAPQEPATRGCEVIELGELRIDNEAHRISVNGQEVSLTRLEFRLLTTMAQRRERVQTRADLLADVWARSALNKTRTVDTHMKRLREKLGSAGRFIQTVRGTGYRLSVDPPGGDVRRRSDSGLAKASVLHLAPGPEAAAV
jgi:DNA-binding winged helix-turn-helix (wHTH) protein